MTSAIRSRWKTHECRFSVTAREIIPLLVNSLRDKDTETVLTTWHIACARTHQIFRCLTIYVPMFLNAWKKIENVSTNAQVVRFFDFFYEKANSCWNFNIIPAVYAAIFDCFVNEKFQGFKGFLTLAEPTDWLTFLSGQSKVFLTDFRTAIWDKMHWDQPITNGGHFLCVYHYRS